LVYVHDSKSCAERHEGSSPSSGTLLMLKKFIKFVKEPVFFVVKLYWRIFKPETEGSKIILTYRNEVLLVKHTYGNKFTFPGGGLKKGENSDDAIKREVIEELSILLKECTYLGSFVSTLYYKKDKIHVYKSELENKDFKIDNLEIDKTEWVAIDKMPTILSNGALEIFNLYK
jgi:8-oxo-dGTP pyrophosphatase MutT (NUDIX family)